MVRRLSLAGFGVFIFTIGAINYSSSLPLATGADAGSADVAAPILSLSPPCEPLYRYQPDRANAAFAAVAPSTSVGLNDFGTMGVYALGAGASLPTLQSCAGAMSARQCANFDGNDRYLATQTIVQSQPVVIAAVVRPELNSWDIVSDTANNTIRHWFGFKSGGQATLQAPTDISTTSTVAANEWSFICADSNGTSSEIYFNGSSVTASAGTNDPIPVSGAAAGFTIGATASNQFNMNGDILDYAIYPSSCVESCSDFADKYYSHKYPEIGLTQGAPNEIDCTRTDPKNICPANGECRIVVVVDSIQQGSNPGASGQAGASCHIGIVGKECTQDGTTGACPCAGAEARTGVIDTMIEDFGKHDCYSRLNRAVSGTRTDTWKADQWDPISATVVADVGVIGGANNDPSTAGIPTCTNIQAIALDMLASGIPKVLVLGAHPQGLGSQHTAVRELKRTTENACLSTWAATTPNVEFQPYDGTIIDGGTAPAYPLGPSPIGPKITIGYDYGDGLHFSNDAGESAAASVIAPYFQ